MIIGYQSFHDWFHGFEDQYAIIGGTACEIGDIKQLGVLSQTKEEVLNILSDIYKK